MAVRRFHLIGSKGGRKKVGGTPLSIFVSDTNNHLRKNARILKSCLSLGDKLIKSYKKCEFCVTFQGIGMESIDNFYDFLYDDYKT